MSSKPKALLNNIISYFQGNPKRVRLLGIAVVGLLVISWGGVTFSSQPGFCGGTCHEMKPAYDNWKTSVHAEVTCNACHIEPGTVNLLIHKVMSYKEIVAHVTTYSKEDAPPVVAKHLKPVNDACTQCHSANREYSFSGDLKVPHQLHIQKGLTCPQCHSRMVHGTEEQRKPKMEVCLTCHDGKKAPDECGACHTKKAVPASHRQANWYQVHGQLSKTVNCQKCHNWRPDWCMDCHKKKPESHQVLWRSSHGDRATTDRAGCNACHKLDFCMRCHGIQP